MAKETQQIALAGIRADASSKVPMYRQLYESIRQAILEGRLRPGQRLPATRALADELGVSRNTILLAFDYLFSEGYLQGKIGSGTFVTETLPEQLLQARQFGAVSAHLLTRKSLSRRGEILAEISFPTAEVIPFRHGIPALNDFPFHIWSKLLTRQFRVLPNHAFGYKDAGGHRPLREAIAHYLRMSRAVRCEAEQIVIVNGSQQALDLTARILLDPGDKIWIEDPGYVGARRAFLAAGLDIIPVPVDSEGLDVDKGQELNADVRLAQVTPSHQYPIGVTMSLARRLKLLEWANQSNAWILEDDYDSEYRYAGPPLSSLQGLDSNYRVIYMGTFSKVLFPALRLGYLVVPPDLVDAFIAAKSVADRNSPILEQATLADFINEGHFGRHIRRMRLLYQKRQEILVLAVKEQLGEFLTIDPAEGGMHEIGWLADGLEEQEVVKRAEKLGVAASPLSSYCLKYKQRPGLVLGYAAFDEKEIRAAVNLLQKVLS